MKYNLKQGDFLTSKNGAYKRKILGICGEVYFLSYGYNFTSIGRWSTFEELMQEFNLSSFEEKWEPKEWEKYWTIDGGGACACCWNNESIDIARKNGLGIYRTVKEAEEAFNKAKNAINEK